MSKPIILIVEDDTYFRSLCSDSFAGEDACTLEAVASAEAGLARLEHGSVDVLIVAMALPGSDSLELVRRAGTLDPPPEVIVTTGEAAVDAAMEALCAGARDYLPRPCRPEHLRHVVRSCLEQRHQREEARLLRSQILLYQKGQQLSSQLDVDTLLQESLELLVQEVGGNVRSLAFLASQGVISRVICGAGCGEAQGQALAEALLPQLDVLDKGGLVPAADLVRTPVAAADPLSLWVFPMQSELGMQGALVIFNRDGEPLPDPFPGEVLLFLGEQAAHGFQNACQYQGARELIYTDDLTGLYNHRYLQVALEQEIRRAERYGLEFSLAFIDLDLFKNVNDVHGHLIGSSVLREVGELLRRCVRDADMLFRYGGDEFTALLVETDTQGARIVSERIRRKIEEHVYGAAQGISCRITATVGHATFPVHANSKQQLIDLADKAMYQGKQVRNVSRGVTEARQS